MNAVVRPIAAARRPTQDRAINRVERVLECADALVGAQGLAGFSIPKLAEELGYSRASIYKFFPTPVSVLNELARRYLKQLEALMNQAAPQLLDKHWSDAVTSMVGIAAKFYEANPVGRVLLLGGPLTDDSYEAQSMVVRRLGKLARNLLEAQKIRVPASPDVATLAVEIGTASLRLSHFLHGRITPEYRREAARAMNAYLQDRIGSEEA